MDSNNRPPDTSPPPRNQQSDGPRRIPSSELFAEAREVQIEHEGETYRLQKTRAGKLILTK